MKFIILVPGLFLFYACSTREAKKQDSSETKKQDPVYSLATVENAGVPSMIKLPAQLSAWQEVSIFPKINAYIKQVYVDIGSKVHAGQSLMLLEAPETQQATMQAKEKYAQSTANYLIDRENYARLQEASATAGAVSPLDLSSARAKMEGDSALSNAEKSNWQMLQNLQDYLHVTAPFNGVITERNVFPGALVDAAAKDKPMLELKDITTLRLKIDVPESFAGSFKENDTISFYTSAFPGKRLVGKISRRSMNINPQYRSERIEVDVENNHHLLQPGMYADVLLYSKGNSNALSVPSSSIVNSTIGKYIIAKRNGKNIKVDVLTGNETKDRIEIFGQIQVGEKVIEYANDEIQTDEAANE